MIEITFPFTCILTAAPLISLKGSVMCGKTATPRCAMSHDALKTIYNKYAFTFHSKNNPQRVDHQKVEETAETGTWEEESSAVEKLN